jgi:hypothetical protein
LFETTEPFESNIGCNIPYSVLINMAIILISIAQGGTVTIFIVLAMKIKQGIGFALVVTILQIEISKFSCIHVM